MTPGCSTLQPDVFRRRARGIGGATALVVLLAVSACASKPTTGDVVKVKLIAFNDFHGNLEAPRAVVRAPEGGPTGDATGPDVDVPAGGIARFATLVNRLRATNPNNAVVSSGDMIGASPLVSALFLDEPTVEAMNLIGVDFNSVGNHEFDRGVPELLRKQSGGCQPLVPAMEPCRSGHPFAGAKFQYLAANVLDRQTGRSIFPGYGIKAFDGVRVGFIGLTLKGTDQIVDPAGIAGVRFMDEAATINAEAAALRGRGVNAIVVLIHEGGDTTGRLNDKSCPGLSGDILPILDRLDPGIDVVASAHTHKAYVCTYRDMLLTSAASYGRLLTDIDLEIERRSGRVVRKTALNRIVASEAFGDVPTRRAYPVIEPDPRLDALVATYASAVSAFADQKVGLASAPLSNRPDEAGQSPLGNVLADGYLRATTAAGARIALLNPGSVRAPVEPMADGSITYGALFRSQPFGNTLVTLTMTGRQIRDVLEQQWIPGRQQSMMLQVSQGFSYAYDDSRPIGSRVLAGTMRLSGAPIGDDRTYRVTVNSFLANGGDSFGAFLAGRERTVGVFDIDAAVAHFQSIRPMPAPAPGRVTRVRR